MNGFVDVLRAICNYLVVWIESTVPEEVIITFSDFIENCVEIVRHSIELVLNIK